MSRRRPRGPYIDAAEQEQPHHIDEMPVPGGSLEAKMLLGIKMPGERPKQRNRQENCSDEHVSAVKARCHEEGSAIDAAREGECGVGIFVSLKGCKDHAEKDRAHQPEDEPAPIIMKQRMMRPGHGRARGEQNERSAPQDPITDKARRKNGR